MPCNLYGVNDNFHPTNSHVLPALIRRFHEAKINNFKEVVCWGDGSARREFLNAYAEIGSGNEEFINKLAAFTQKFYPQQWEQSKVQ